MTKLLNKLHLDDILVQFSIRSRYHLVSVAWLAWGMMFSAVNYINHVFVAEQVDYRCAGNSSNLDLASSTSTKVWCADLAEPCAQWIYDKPNSLMAELFGEENHHEETCAYLRSNGGVCEVPNPHWALVRTMPQPCCDERRPVPSSRALIDYCGFQLACQEWKRTLVGTAHTSGYMVGILILGALSDRFGRKRTGVISGLISTAFGLAKGFTSNYFTYVVLEFMEATMDPFAPLYTLVIENVAPDSRFTYVVFCQCGIVVGGILFVLLAFSLPNWRTLVRVWYAQGLLFILFIYFVDESPRWLLSKGKTSKAVSIVKKASKVSKVDIKEDLNLLSYEDEERSSFSQALADTFKSLTLLKRLFVCCTWWVTSTFVYHGLVFNAVALNGSRHLNMVLTIVSRLPGNIAAMYTMKKLNRRLPLLMAFFACAVICVGQPFVPKDIPWLAVSVYMIGQMLSSGFFNITYLFTSELFPTHTRISMQSLCSSVGRIGGILATQTPLLLVYWSGLPTVLFGAASLAAGMVTFLVPDTADKRLPDTVGQAVALEADEVRNRRNVADDL